MINQKSDYTRMNRKKKKPAPIIIANWKMNGTLIDSMQLFKDLRKQIHESLVGCEIVICPPFTLLRDFAEKVPGTGVKLGGQNCHHAHHGAFTGEISAMQLKDMMCDYVIVGHSERRIQSSEGSELVQKKAAHAHTEKLTTIICIGETQYEHDNDLTKIIIREQLLHSIPKSANNSNTIIAYEPVWAIGTGKTPTDEQISSTHQYIKKIIAEELPHIEDSLRIVYGGSVNKDNAQELLANDHVDGLLVGKSSLNMIDFWGIIDAAS